MAVKKNAVPAATNEAGITWSLVERDRSKLQPNPNNPKIQDEQGLTILQKMMKKFGLIYDGIINFDGSIIDGHSRWEEMKGVGIGNYFMPSRQLNQKEEDELNALFDLARAGKPDMFAIEHILSEEVFKEFNVEEGKKGKKDKHVTMNVKYPLVPQYDERHEAIVIMASSSIDLVFIKEVLGIDKAHSYKNNKVKETSVVTAKQFIQKWKERK